MLCGVGKVIAYFDSLNSQSYLFTRLWAFCIHLLESRGENDARVWIPAWNMHPLLALTQTFCISRGRSSCCGGWWTQFGVRRGLEEALVGMEGGHGGHFHVGSLGESAARGQYSASPHLGCCSPRQPRWQCSVLGGAGEESRDPAAPLLTLKAPSCSGETLSWPLPLGLTARLPALPPPTSAVMGRWPVIRNWVHHPHGRHTAQLEKQAVSRLETPLTVYFCI